MYNWCPSRFAWLVTLFLQKTETVDVKGVFTLKHVGGIRKIQPLPRYLCRRIIDEPVKDREVISALGKVNNIPPHLRRAIGVFLLSAFMHDKAPMARLKCGGILLTFPS